MIQDVQPNVKTRLSSLTTDVSEQDASWQMCVRSFISLGALVFEKQSLTPTIKMTTPFLQSDPFKYNKKNHVTYRAGPSCSKLTTSLVNDSLKFTSSDTQIC